MRTSSIAILGFIALGALAGCGSRDAAPEAASPANYGAMSRGGGAGGYEEAASIKKSEVTISGLSTARDSSSDEPEAWQGPAAPGPAGVAGGSANTPAAS
jgi:hypothetical protein